MRQMFLHDVRPRFVVLQMEASKERFSVYGRCAYPPAPIPFVNLSKNACVFACIYDTHGINDTRLRCDRLEGQREYFRKMGVGVGETR